MARNDNLRPLDPIFDVDTVYGGIAVGNTPGAALVSVTIEQGSGQDDPTLASPIVFDVVFSEAVTGFATGDVTLSGSAGADTAIVTNSGDDINYTVDVSGMTSGGTVTAIIPAGVATSIASGAPNSASTSTDNTVTFVAAYRDYDGDDDGSFTQSVLDVTAWADKNAVGPTLVTTGGGANDPIRGAIANALGGVRFDNIDPGGGGLIGDFMFATADSTNIGALATSTGVTLYAVFNCLNTTAQLFGAWQANSDTASVFQLRINSSGQVEFRWVNSAGTVIKTFATSGTFNDGSWHVARLTVSAGDVTIEVDGANRVTDTYTVSGSFSYTREGMGAKYITSAGSSTSQQLNGCVARVMIFNLDLDGTATATAVYDYLDDLYLVPAAQSQLIAGTLGALGLGGQVGAYFVSGTSGTSRTARAMMPEDVRAGDIAVWISSYSNNGNNVCPSGFTVRSTGGAGGFTSGGTVATRTCLNGDGLRSFTETINGSHIDIIFIFRDYFVAEAPTTHAEQTLTSSGNIQWPDVTAGVQPLWCLATSHWRQAASGTPALPSGTNPTYATLLTASAWGSGLPRLAIAAGTSTNTGALGLRTAANTGFDNFYGGQINVWETV